MFEKYVETSLLAQFDRDIQPVKEITLKFCPAIGLRPRKKLRLLHIRLTPLQNNLRCVLKQSTNLSFFLPGYFADFIAFLTLLAKVWLTGKTPIPHHTLVGLKRPCISSNWEKNALFPSPAQYTILFVFFYYLFIFFFHPVCIINYK